MATSSFRRPPLTARPPAEVIEELGRELEQLWAQQEAILTQLTDVQKRYEAALLLATPGFVPRALTRPLPTPRALPRERPARMKSSALVLQALRDAPDGLTFTELQLAVSAHPEAPLSLRTNKRFLHQALEPLVDGTPRQVVRDGLRFKIADPAEPTS